MNSKGDLIIHPNKEGQNMSSFDFIQEMMIKKNGYLKYPWEGKDKILVYSYIESLDWIIASGSYLSDFETPINNIRKDVYKRQILGSSQGFKKEQKLVFALLCFTWNW